MDNLEISLMEASEFDPENFFGDSPDSRSVETTVRKILEQVQKNGDRALLDLSERFDGVLPDSLRVPEKTLHDCLDAIPSPLRTGLEKAKANIEAYHRKQLPESWFFEEETGVRLGQFVRPIDRAGIYVPGGKAVYPSTVLMNAVPAKIAGVSSLALCSPPGADGIPHPTILACCALTGIEEVYAVGGAQAIGAMAYGTESIRPVFKITGPGNAYVAEAKKQVFGKVGIDSVAGPSELAILHDRLEIDPEWIAGDCLAQAEHDEMAKVVLLTTCEKTAREVIRALQVGVMKSQRKAILQKSVGDWARIIRIQNLDEGIELVNRLAPEHLQLFTAEEVSEKIQNAGSIFSGKWSTAVLGDYFAGPNHTLPTNGCSRFASPLGVYDFIKFSSYVRYTENALKDHASSIATIASSESLEEHANSVLNRCQK